MLARYWEGQEAKLENERESCGQQKHLRRGGARGKRAQQAFQWKIWHIEYALPMRRLLDESVRARGTIGLRSVS